MSGQAMRDEGADRGRVLRYVVNGVVATAVHFTFLSLFVRVLEVESAGLANLVAASIGIATSFLGSRYYVFRRRADSILAQAARFGALYASIALLHGLVLFAWTDVLRLDYRLGFLLATGLQVMLSYWGNKLLVFNR
jgi:putative flippase GtrA